MLAMPVSNVQIMTAVTAETILANAEQERMAARSPRAISVPESRADRLEIIQRESTSAYSRHADWINFFREILGPDGIIRKMFSSPQELADFEKSEEHAAIQQMLTKLRERSGDSTEDEPMRVITIRLPKSLHESLKVEANLHRTSMNQLCISKLLQLVDKDFIPNA
jgi:predicted HicB family RNase H-like nuclease